MKRSDGVIKKQITDPLRNQRRKLADFASNASVDVSNHPFKEVRFRLLLGGRRFEASMGNVAPGMIPDWSSRTT